MSLAQISFGQNHFLKRSLVQVHNVKMLWLNKINFILFITGAKNKFARKDDVPAKPFI